MQKRVEILERHVAFVAGLLERVHHRRPVRGPVQQCPKRIKRMVRPLLGELLEMDVLDPTAQYRNPVFGELKEHDVAGVEVDLDVLATERVDERVHLAGRRQVAVEEDVLDVEVDAVLLGKRYELADRLAGAAVADVDRHRFSVGNPGNIRRAGDRQEVFGPQLVGCLDHQAG